MNIRTSAMRGLVIALSFAGIVLLYFCRIGLQPGPPFSHPTWTNWFGTDSIGNDVFLESIQAMLIAVGTLVVVLPAVYLGGFVVGGLISYWGSAKARELSLNLVHYWLTLPILLIAIFLLILLGASQKNVILVLIFVLIPSQSLYVYSKMEEAKKLEFVLAKRSYGLSRRHILLHHLYPYVRSSFGSYTLSRMPEILMMDLAFNYLGLGVQPPQSSFGGMLFDGLSFMFSGWWLWALPVMLVILLFHGVHLISKSVVCEGSANE